MGFELFHGVHPKIKVFFFIIMVLQHVQLLEVQNKKFKTKSAKSAIFHHFTQSAEQKVQNYISPLKVQKKKCNISYVAKTKG